MQEGNSMGGYVTQTRKDPSLTDTYTYRNSPGQTLFTGTYLPALEQARQTTTSFRTGRAGPSDDQDFPKAQYQGQVFRELADEYRRGPQSGYDTGHTFDTERRWFNIDMSHKTVKGDPANVFEKDFVYNGPITIDPTTSGGHRGTFPDFGIPAAYTGSTVDGVKAINQTIPTFPVASLNTAIPELAREGIPQMVGHTLHNFGDLIRNPFAGAADEHLNWQFGWTPLISDVKKACHAILEAKKLLEQYERDSGRLVRRRFNFGEEVSTSWASVALDVRNNGMPQKFINAFTSVSQMGAEVIRVSKRKWFSGAYTYYYEADEQSKVFIDSLYKKANHLLGLEITPDVLWNLAPWSWLSDWAVNVGDNLANANRFSEDNLVMKYGYLMHETQVSWTRTGVFPVRTGERHGLSLESCYSRKERFKSTPYGFGLTTSAFSLKQWSILGALGFAKSPQRLFGD